MSDITTEQRLRLVHQIRQEHNQNRQAIQSRERILYGREMVQQGGNLQENTTLQGFRDDYVMPKEADNFLPQSSLPNSTFGLRMLIAAVLFVGYFFLESSKISFGALNAEVIRTEVNRYSDVEINLFDFMDNITYTFNND